MRRTGRRLGVVMAVLIASSCNGTEVVEPVEPPVPRCIELEARMVECAREAAGVEHLPSSVEEGLRQAAGLNCRRMRSATHDPELPARVVAACASETCATFSPCVARAAEREGFVAMTGPPPTGGGPGPTAGGPSRVGTGETGSSGQTSPPPDVYGTEGTSGTGYGEGDGYDYAGGYGEGDGYGYGGGGGYGEGRYEADTLLICAPFVEKMLGCAEDAAGGSLDELATEDIAAAFGDVCVQLGYVPQGVLDEAFSACAESSCDAYVPCVTERLGYGEE